MIKRSTITTLTWVSRLHCVKAVLLYGSECWRITKGDMRKVDVFHNRCLRKICNIYWPNKIRNVELHKKTDSMNMSLEIKHRRLRWLGHVLRMSEERIPKVAMRYGLHLEEGKEAGQKPPGGQPYFNVQKEPLNE